MLKNFVFISKILPDWSFQGKAVGWNSVSYKIIISSGFKKGLIWDDIFGHYTSDVWDWWRILSDYNLWVIPSSKMCHIISKIGHMLPKCFSSNYWGTIWQTQIYRARRMDDSLTLHWYHFAVRCSRVLQLWNMRFMKLSLRTDHVHKILSYNLKRNSSKIWKDDE